MLPRETTPKKLKVKKLTLILSPINFVKNCEPMPVSRVSIESLKLISRNARL